MDFEGIAICHIQCIGRIGICDPSAVEEKPDCLFVFSLPITKSVHEFLQLSGSLDLEEHFVVPIRHLDVQMLGWLRWFAHSAVR